MIDIGYDQGRPYQIVERIGTGWKVTLILYNALGDPVLIGEGEGWDFQDAYNLAQQDLNLRPR